MRKYYYYYYRYDKGFGCGLCYSDNSCFPISQSTNYVRETVDDSATISFWHEISVDEYEKMLELIETNDFEKKSNLF